MKIQTRSTINLSKIPYKKFYSDYQDPRKILYPTSYQTKVQSKVQTNEKSNIELQSISNYYQTPNKFLIFDIECYKFDRYWKPTQIAWGVYSWNENKLQLQSKKMFYIKKYFTNQKYIECMSDFYFNKHQKFFGKMQENLLTATKILQEFEKDLNDHQVQVVASFNISEDLKSIKKLIQSANKSKLHTLRINEKFTNPFHDNIKYLDLMHIATQNYIDSLIESGLKQNKIWLCKETNRIRLGKNRREKSIYSAEYILKEICNITQTHFAQDDVEHESILLENILQQFGQENIEYNIMYNGKLYDKVSSYISKNYKIPKESEKDEKHKSRSFSKFKN